MTGILVRAIPPPKIRPLWPAPLVGNTKIPPPLSPISRMVGGRSVPRRGAHVGWGGSGRMLWGEGVRQKHLVGNLIYSPPHKGGGIKNPLQGCVVARRRRKI